MTSAARAAAPGGRHDLRLSWDGADDPWPISDERRRAVVEALADLVLHAPDERDRVAAALVLVAMDRQNLRWEQLRAGQEQADQSYRPCGPGRPA